MSIDLKVILADLNQPPNRIREEVFGIRQLAAGDIAIDRELDDWDAYHADLMQHAN